MAEKTSKEESMQMATAETTAMTKRRRKEHPHFCLFDILHLTSAMKLLIGIGLLAITAFCVLEAFYFRRALILMIIPTTVIIFSTLALVKNNPHLLWPIIGISFFHLFLVAYLMLIFLFFYIFKPLYIIMVLNWAFDTTYTTKTASYYASSAAIFTVLTCFFLFNLWQLRISYLFQAYLEELLSSNSSGTSSTSFGGCSENGMSNGNQVESLSKSGQRIDPTNHQNDGYLQLRKCKVLNEPPVMLFGGASNNSNYYPNFNKMLLCPSPAMSQRECCGHHKLMHQSLGLGPRRASLNGSRHFGTG